ETFARMPSSPDVVVVAASDARTCFQSQTRNVVDHRISRHGFKSIRIPAAHFDQLTQDPQSFSALYAIEGQFDPRPHISDYFAQDQPGRGVCRNDLDPGIISS